MKRIVPVFIVTSVALAVVTSAQESTNAPPPMAGATSGRMLFVRNCAHCHGVDAHGDEGPDLYDLDWTDQQITNRIRNGKAGQMTAFHDHFSQQQITSLIAYLRTLK
jgi:mono/diheme cytochrome c family protein